MNVEETATPKAPASTSGASTENLDAKFAEITLKDALEGIHKAVGARLAVMGLFFSLISGSFALAATQRALVFLIAAMVFTAVFLAIELPQRMALCSYYFRYIDVARNCYHREPDYSWIAGFTPIALLRHLDAVASGEYSSIEDKARALKSALSPFRTPTFSAITATLIGAELGVLLWAWLKLCWPILPSVT